MNVIWKRPDGFLGAKPEDYITLNLGDHSNIWLHRSNNRSYPFRVSGGWEDEKQTLRLNRLVNLLGSDKNQTCEFLREEFHHSMAEDGPSFLADVKSWLSGLKAVVKGDTWEVEIISCAIEQVEERVAGCDFSQLGKS